VARRPLEEEGIYLACGRRTTQLMRDSLGSTAERQSESVLVSDLVTVFESSDIALFALAKTVLDQAGIRYIVQGEGLQDLFGVGRIGTGFNLITGPPRIRVTADNVERARHVLAELTT
jgi:putative signal transducing protein